MFSLVDLLIPLCFNMQQIDFVFLPKILLIGNILGYTDYSLFSNVNNDKQILF